jgi:hypothetical protein
MCGRATDTQWRDLALASASVLSPNGAGRSVFWAALKGSLGDAERFAGQEPRLRLDRDHVRVRD